jgi:hypothetical protein
VKIGTKSVLLKTKRCCRCMKRKRRSSFRKKSASRDGLWAACKKCVALYNRGYYQSNKDEINRRSKAAHKANPERKAAYARRHKWKKTCGLTQEQFDNVFRRQHGLCAIRHCGRPISDVDHCHRTKRFRGLLCGSCNRALGLIADSVPRLRGLAEYLDSFHV